MCIKLHKRDSKYIYIKYLFQRNAEKMYHASWKMYHTFHQNIKHLRNTSRFKIENSYV